MSDWEETVKERAAAMQEKWAGEGSAPFLRLVDGEVEPGTCWSCGEVMAAGEDDSRCDPCAAAAHFVLYETIPDRRDLRPLDRPRRGMESYEDDG